MAPYLRSHRRNMFIGRLSDWDLWQMMNIMEDQELVNFSSTCKRFRIVATDILVHRSKVRRFAHITFKYESGNICCASRTGPRGRPNYWFHPLEILHAICRSPSVADYIQSIDSVNAMISCRDGLSVASCPHYTTLEKRRLRSIVYTNVARLLPQFLPSGRIDEWQASLRRLHFVPAILLLALLCPNLKVLSFTIPVRDGSFGHYIADLVPMMWHMPSISTHGSQSLQLAMPPLEKIGLLNISYKPVRDLRSILNLCLIPTLRSLLCSDVNESLTQIYGPMQRHSTIKNLLLIDSTISPQTMIRLISDMPRLKELLYSDTSWRASATNGHERPPKPYTDDILLHGGNLLQSRNLVITLLDKRQFGELVGKHGWVPAADISGAIRIGQ